MKKTKNLSVDMAVLVAVILLMVTGCKKTDEPETVTDIDGNVYKTVVIGTQTWMAENLKTKLYNNGDLIPDVTSEIEWDGLGTDAFCWYNNDQQTYKATYGALYNWYAVNTGKLCPAGWHVPSDAEWTTFIDFLDGRDYAGGKMKEMGTLHWVAPNTEASDTYGFKALPAGDRSAEIAFGFWGIGEYAAWWSSTGKDATHSYFLEAYYNSETVYKTYTNNRFGFSVRCIKN